MKKYSIIFFILVLFVIVHKFIVMDYEDNLFYSVFAIYAINIGVSLLLFLVAKFIERKKAKTSIYYMLLPIVRIFVMVVFIVPMGLYENDYYVQNILSFILPYFLFLFFETYLTVQIIKK